MKRWLTAKSELTTEISFKFINVLGTLSKLQLNVLYLLLRARFLKLKHNAVALPMSACLIAQTSRWVSMKCCAGDQQ
jgi:hypothetical protein